MMSGLGPGILGGGMVLMIVVLAVLIAIKGYALWIAAKRNEQWWFIALLVINTFAILELIYLIGIAKVWPKRGYSPKPGV